MKIRIPNISSELKMEAFRHSPAFQINKSKGYISVINRNKKNRFKCEMDNKENNEVFICSKLA